MYALGEIISCIGVTAWQGQQSNGSSWHEMGHSNDFFCEKGLYAGFRARDGLSPEEQEFSCDDG